MTAYPSAHVRRHRRRRRFRWRFSCTASRTRRIPGGTSGRISRGSDTGSSRRGFPGTTHPCQSRSARGRTFAHSSTFVASIRADERAVLIGHDWGANAGYGVVAADPDGIQPLGRPCGASDRCAWQRASSATRNSGGRSTSGSSSRLDSLKPRSSSQGSGSHCGRTGHPVTTPAKTSLSCDDT